MAILAAGLAGAALGNTVLAGGFLGMSGASIGWTAGIIAGQYFFGPKPKDQHNYGPRLDDTKIMGAQYGVGLPRVYGSARLAGTMIWCTDIREEAVTTSERAGGKGGGGAKVENTTYSYYGTWAVALCGHYVFRVGRVWADGEVLVDLRESDNPQEGGHVEKYFGTETQTANSTMQADLGSDKTPAYRGTAYLVFEDIPLARFGNRIPGIEVEVFAGTSGANNRWMSPTEIVTAVAADCGITAAELDLSELSTLAACQGVSQSSLMTGRAMLEHLQRAWLVDFCELDGTLTARRRDTAAVLATLDDDALGAEVS
jgi:hypothetical protein